MSKVLKRLYLGDVVKSFGAKQLRKLTTEEPMESIVGTWMFNDRVDVSSTYGNWNISYSFVDSSGKTVTYTRINVSNSKYAIYYYIGASSITAYSGGAWNNANYQTITILEEPTDETFITWLKANATKQ